MIGGNKGEKGVIIDALNKHELELAMRLILAGKDPNALGRMDGDLVSPLHAAVRMDLPEIAQALIDNGADPNLVVEDKSALDLAREYRSQIMIKIMVSENQRKAKEQMKAFCHVQNLEHWVKCAESHNFCSPSHMLFWIPTSDLFYVAMPLAPVIDMFVSMWNNLDLSEREKWNAEASNFIALLRLAHLELVEAIPGCKGHICLIRQNYVSIEEASKQLAHIIEVRRQLEGENGSMRKLALKMKGQFVAPSVLGLEEFS
jgi:hypothetical protein